MARVMALTTKKATTLTAQPNTTGRMPKRKSPPLRNYQTRKPAVPATRENTPAVLVALGTASPRP